MNRKLLSLGAAAALTFSLAACGDDTGSAAASEGPVEILLPFPEGLPFAPLIAAKEQGFFEDNGVEIKTSVADGSGYVSQQLLSGNVDFAVLSSADFAVAASKREDARLLICHQVKNVYRIVATEQSGITDVDGLKGHTLGITEPGGGENQFVKAALAEAGLSDLEVLPVGPAGPQSLAAIQDGKIDGYSSSYPDIASLTASGLSFVDITPEKYNNVPGVCIATTQEYLDSEGGEDNATAVAKSWVDGLYYTLENEQEAFDTVCEVNAEACANEAAAKALYTEALNVIRPDNGGRPGEVDPAAWNTVVEILSANDSVPADLDLTENTSGGTIDSIREAAYEGRE